MIPTLVPTLLHREGWVYEEKVDGYRLVAYKDGGAVRLLSRHGVDHAPRYPDVTSAIARLKPATLVLDGELAVFDAQLRSRFDWLRHRQTAELATPPTLIAFDVLYVNGRDLAKRPLRHRRARLEDLVAGADLVHAARRLAPNALEAWAQALERGYEGFVAKDDASPYVGGRTRAWLKVKVPGWTAGEHRWRRTLESSERSRRS
jgi:bifunctional non-homologous end joining protein LigD